MQAAGLDPLSQLVGGLSAQVQNLAATLIDLRSEIVTNRQINQSRWDDLSQKIDLVQAEYRNVKHSERTLQEKEILVNDRLKGIEGRLAEIEKVILIWRVRVSLLLTLGVAAGAVLGFLIHVAADAAARNWLG